MKVTRFLFLATIFSVTFEKVHWNVAGTVSLADILAIGFLVMWALERLARRDRRLPRTSAIVTWRSVSGAVGCHGSAGAICAAAGLVTSNNNAGTARMATTIDQAPSLKSAPQGPTSPR